MLSLLSAFAPFIMNALGFFLNLAGAKLETKRAFFRLVDNMGKDGLISVKLHQSYEEQRKQLEQMP